MEKIFRRRLNTLGQHEAHPLSPDRDTVARRARFSGYGNRLFKVSFHLRCRHNRNLRVARKSRGIKTLEEASREQRRLKRQCEDLLHDRVTKGAILGYLINSWAKYAHRTKVETGEVGEKYVNDCKGTLKKWLAPFLHQSAHYLTSYALTDVMRNMRSQDISSNQLFKFQRMVRDVFEFGILKSFLPKGTNVPLGSLKLKNSEEKVPEILSNKEIRKLIEESILRNHPWKNVWAFALLTGMRSGELRALEWSDIDLENKLVRVSKSIQTESGLVKSTKAGYWRDVPISPDLGTVLKELKAEDPTRKYVLPRLDKWNGNQASVIRKFCEEIGLPSVRFHTLRACFATQLLRNGVEAAKVMKVCGWRDLSTMQRYVRLAGVEVMGVTDSLSVLPSPDFKGKVIHFGGARTRKPT